MEEEEEAPVEEWERSMVGEKITRAIVDVVVVVVVGRDVDAAISEASAAEWAKKRRGLVLV